MWQRPQTIYMAFSIMMLLAALFFPAFSGELANGHWIDVYAIKMIDNDPVAQMIVDQPLLAGPILLFAAMGFILAAILSYKNRPRQMQILTAAIVVQLALIGYLGWVYADAVGAGAMAPGIRGGIVLILTSIILDWVGIRLIRKDEKLVRGSRDRLR